MSGHSSSWLPVTEPGIEAGAKVSLSEEFGKELKFLLHYTSKLLLRYNGYRRLWIRYYIILQKYLKKDEFRLLFISNNDI